MTIKSQNVDLLAELAELSVTLVPSPEASGDYSILAFVAFFPHDIDEETGFLRLAFNNATLSIDLDGLNVVPGTKRGLKKIPLVTSNEIQRERSVSTAAGSSSTRSAEVNGSATGGGGKISEDRKKEKSAQESDKQIFTERIEHYSMEAVGNNNWRFKNADGSPLHGVYSDYEPLFSASRPSGANRSCVEASLIVSQRDIAFDWSGSRGWFSWRRSPNQQKIAEILVKKGLHRMCGSNEPFAGRLLICKSEAADED